MNVRAWTPPRFANTPLLDDEVRTLTYNRPLTAASVYQCRAMTGYSRTSIPSSSRAARTRSFFGFYRPIAQPGSNTLLIPDKDQKRSTPGVDISESPGLI